MVWLCSNIGGKVVLCLCLDGWLACCSWYGRQNKKVFLENAIDEIKIQKSIFKDCCMRSNGIIPVPILVCLVKRDKPFFSEKLKSIIQFKKLIFYLSCTSVKTGNGTVTIQLVGHVGIQAIIFFSRHQMLNFLFFIWWHQLVFIILKMFSNCTVLICALLLVFSGLKCLILVTQSPKYTLFC